MVPGAPAADAPVRVAGEPAWFLAHTGGSFVAVVFSDSGTLGANVASDLDSLAHAAIPVRTLVVVPKGVASRPQAGYTVVEDAEGMLAQRFDAREGTCYLLRPDQHVCAPWRRLDPARVRGAVARATCNA
jgi:3-(3-hydroxy-phenyl)propionate hydroxylase